MAPSFALVSRYFIASVVSFVVFCILLLANYYDIHGHHFQPKLLALTHIATLGWISMIIFGAMFQLIPVVLEVRLHSEKLAAVQFWLYCAGIIGLTWGFWTFSVGMHLTASGGLLTLAIFLFIYNVLRTMANVRKWDITGLFLLTAIVYLGLTALSGFVLAYNLGFPFIGRLHLDYLKIHAHLGFIGWVVMVIMGVGLKLIPMFGLSHNFSRKPAVAAYVLTNIGLLGTTIEWTFTGPGWLLNIYIAVLAGGLAAFLVQIAAIMKNRLRKTLDAGMKHSAVAFGYCGVATAVGLILAFFEPAGEAVRESVVLAYGIVIIVGFFSTLIIGQMYKIVPFLVWFHTYSDRAGKEPVPMLRDLTSESVAMRQFWLLNAGILTIIGGTVFSQQYVQLAGFALLTLAALLFAYNIAAVFGTWRIEGNEGKNS
jgi:hypothetical protein